MIHSLCNYAFRGHTSGSLYRGNSLILKQFQSPAVQIIFDVGLKARSFYESCPNEIQSLSKNLATICLSCNNHEALINIYFLLSVCFESK